MRRLASSRAPAEATDDAGDAGTATVTAMANSCVLAEAPLAEAWLAQASLAEASLAEAWLAEAWADGGEGMAQKRSEPRKDECRENARQGHEGEGGCRAQLPRRGPV